MTLRLRSAGGWSFAEDPALPAGVARPFWSRRTDAGVLVADALRAGPNDRYDLALGSCGARTTLLQRTGRPEELLIRQDMCHIRLILRQGSLASGSVRLRFALRGLRNLERQTLTLRQLDALRRYGRVPERLVARGRRYAQHIALLRVHDAIHAGATHREIAEQLFDPIWLVRGWNGRSDFLRSHVRRMIALRRSLVAHGYPALLS